MLTCTTHICLLYKGIACIFILYEIQYNYSVFLTWYQSHCSDLFWVVLSLLVCLQSQHRFRHHSSRRSLSPLNLRRLSAVVLGFRTCSRRCQGVSHCTDHCPLHLRCKYCSVYVCKGTTEIVLCRSTQSWKPRPQRRLHAPPRAAKRFCLEAHALHAPPTRHYTSGFFFTRSHAPHPQVTRSHAPSRATTLLLTSLLMSSTSALVVPLLTSLAYVSRWRHLLTSEGLTVDFSRLTVDFDLSWPLTFLPELTFVVQVLLTQFFA